MNCLPGLRGAVLILALGATACAAQESVPPVDRHYDLRYTVTPEPATGRARVRLELGQSRHLLRELAMSMPAARFHDVDGDGELDRDGDRVSWLPPANGGTLRWAVDVPHRRYDERYDAWLDDDRALFRGADLMPPAYTRTLQGARSRTSLAFELPDGWSSLTEYRERDGVYVVANDERRFDRPAGWMLLGDLGVRIETIAGVRVLVGGPTGDGVRRLDMLALLNWTLPSLTRLLPDFPDRLTIISAGGHMWRGGLSGPRSLFLHASLPLISENATSTLVHELLHIGTGLSAAGGADWIVEGLAEYYGLEILRRSRTITTRRFATALSDQAAWGREARRLCGGASTGARTARAVTLFAALHRELRADGTNGSDPLDDLLRALVESGDKVSVSQLRRLATRIHGSPPKALSADNLPGCDS